VSYRNPPIQSSYAQNDLGRVLYDEVMKRRPKRVVEYGALYGYSAAAIAQALRDLGEGGRLVSYDLWEDYPHRHGTIGGAAYNLSCLGLSEFVDFERGALGQHDLSGFDLMHLDVSNDGDKLRLARALFAGPILFEGGSAERDGVDWMQTYGRAPIAGSISYEVLDSRFPSISYSHGH
jgi:hypothetical protein